MELNEAIKKYFYMGLNYSEILEFLLTIDGIYLSLRSLKRKLNLLSLTRRKNFTPLANVREFLSFQVQHSPQLHGYKWMHLKCIQSGFVVTQETVRHLLLDLDPEVLQFDEEKG